MNKKNKGFTLIELLVVISIIAVLSSIALVQYVEFRKTSYKTAVKADLKNSLTLIVGFYSTYNSFPISGSCGPGPASCDLTDGTHTVENGIVVSRGVTVSWNISGDRCPDGSEKLVITGRHNQLTGWEAYYNSCDNSFSGF